MPGPGPAKTTAARRLSAVAAALIAPPRCLACRSLPDAPLDIGLCPACRAALAAPPPAVPRIAGIERAGVVALYEGAARSLVAALKAGRLPAVALTIAELIAEAAPATPRPLAAAAVVAVPSGRGRGLRRGLDPAGEIARALAVSLEIPLADPLRRLDARPQRGRSRAQRLADPPRFAATGSLPEQLLLVDDVITTGASLRACAAVAAKAGARRTSALCFALTPPPRGTSAPVAGARRGRPGGFDRERRIGVRNLEGAGT